MHFSTFNKPNLLLAFSCLLTVGCIVMLATAGMVGRAAVTRIEDRYVPLERLTNEIVYYDEVLTQSARLAATTGDPKWEQRYLENVEELDRVIAEIRAHSNSGLFSVEHLDRVDESNQWLVRTESVALELAVDGETGAARELLFNAEYQANKATYANGIEALRLEMRAAISADVDGDRRIAFAVMTAAGLALLVTLAVFGWLWRAMSRWRQRLAELEEQRLVQADQIAENRLRALTDSSADVAMVVDDELRLLFVSTAVERVLKWKAQDLVGSHLGSIVTDEDCVKLEEMVAGAVKADQKPIATELQMRTVDGEWRAMEVFARDRRDDDRLGGVVLNAHDVTDRVDAEAHAHELFEKEKLQSRRLRHQAEHDGLTGLLNRSTFQRLLPQELSKRDRSCCLFMIDIDGFKDVNDTRGHQVGDRVLRQLAKRLEAVVRTEDLLARLGGDEFAVLIKDASDVNVDALADRILDAVATPIADESGLVEVSASIGITAPDIGTGDAEAALADADLAMYSAKRNGRNRSAYFEMRMRKEFVDRVKLTKELEKAIELQEFVVHYQPIWAVEEGEISAAEALVRWQHPTRGLLAPGAFLPLAEESGLVTEIDAQVLAEACRQAAEWGESGDPALEGLQVTVNVSALDLTDALVALVKEQLSLNNLSADRLLLELTETAVVSNVERSKDCLAAIRELGVSLALDDFGTGYSSLSQLQKLSFDVLKVDRSFVIADDVATQSLAKTIVGLADLLNMRVVAEGIETEAQLTRVKGLGCDFGQGFLLAKPMPGWELTTLCQLGLAPQSLTPERRNQTIN